jgi:hypothetical protein
MLESSCIQQLIDRNRNYVTCATSDMYVCVYVYVYLFMRVRVMHVCILGNVCHGMKHIYLIIPKLHPWCSTLDMCRKHTSTRMTMHTGYARARTMKSAREAAAALDDCSDPLLCLCRSLQFNNITTLPAGVFDSLTQLTNL